MELEIGIYVIHLGDSDSTATVFVKSARADFFLRLFRSWTCTEIILILISESPKRVECQIRTWY